MSPQPEYCGSSSKVLHVLTQGLLSPEDIKMRRNELLTTEEGAQFLITNWEEYLNEGNRALEIVNNFNN